jgi:hypothetical protein
MLRNAGNRLDELKPDWYPVVARPLSPGAMLFEVESLCVVPLRVIGRWNARQDHLRHASRIALLQSRNF